MPDCAKVIELNANNALTKGKTQKVSLIRIFDASDVRPSKGVCTDAIGQLRIVCIALRFHCTQSAANDQLKMLIP